MFIEFNSKIKHNEAYFEPPGTGPEFRTCNECVHLVHEITDGPELRKQHARFCGLVVMKIGPLKEIKVETPACRAFVQKPKPPKRERKNEKPDDGIRD